MNDYRKVFSIAIEIFLLVLFYLILFVSVSFAQDDVPPPPQNAQDAAKALELYLVALVPIVAGLLGERVVHFLKRIPWLQGRDCSTAKQLVVQVFGIAAPIVLAWAFAYMSDIAAYLDQNQIWPVIVAAWPVAHITWAALKQKHQATLTQALVTTGHRDG